MSREPELIVLDTNVLVRLIRNDAAGQRIREEYSLDSRTERPLISIITIGELRSLAEQWNWGEKKKVQLSELLRELVIIRVSQGDITQRYAEIDFHNRKKESPARPIGEFLSAGTHLVWLLDPQRGEARVFRSNGSVTSIGEEGVLDGEDVVPGFSCSLAAVLQPA